MNSKLLNKLTWLPVLNDLRALMKVGLSSNQKVIIERMLRNFVLIVFGVGSVAGGLFLYAVLNLSSGVADTNLVVTTDASTEIVVPATPGNTSAKRICTEGLVSSGQVHIDGNSNPDVRGYLAVLGPERMTYTDSPPGGKNLVVILNGNSQTVQPEVIECLLKRGK